MELADPPAESLTDTRWITNTVLARPALSVGEFVL